MKRFDPYFSTTLCVEKLFEQYKKHGNILVAFDYDDTIHDYHKKGYEFPKVMEILRECSVLGLTMILYTGNEDIDNILNYLKGQGIRVDHVNCSPIEAHKKKPYFNILLDNNAGLGQAYEILSLTLLKIKEKKNDSNGQSERFLQDRP